MVQVRLVMLSISQSLVLSITAVLGLLASHAQPQWNKNTGLQEILTAECLDEWSDVDKKHCQPKQHPKRTTNATKRVKVMDNLSDPDSDDDDDEYQMEVVASDSTSEATQASNASEGGISNKEVSAVLSIFLPFSNWFQLANVLPSKMVPARMRRAHAAKRKHSEKSAGNDPQRSEATTPCITPSSSVVVEGSSKETKQVSLFAECISTTNQNDLEISNPIYHFYLALQGAPQGIKAEHGDRFYQCYHGRKKILKVTKKMKYNLNGKVYVPSVNLSAFGLIFLILSGLTENLRSCSPDMFKFYSYLKDHAPQVPLSTKDKKIASGDIELSSAKLAEITQRHDACQQSLKNVFARQQEKATVSHIHYDIIFCLPVYHL